MRAAPAKVQWLVVALLLIGAAPVVVTSASWPYGVLLVAAVVLSEPLARREPRPSWLNKATNVAVLLSLMWILIEWKWLDRPGVLIIADFILLLSCCKLFESRRWRDLALLWVVSLMLLLVACVVSAELAFPIALAGFVILGPYVGMLLHLERERERVHRGCRAGAQAPNRPAFRAAASSLRGLSMAIGAGCLLLGAGFFLLFPRFSGRSTAFLGPARTLTGFAANTNLDPIDPIGESNEVVMRVEVTRDGEPVGAGAHTPYLRGYARPMYLRVPPPAARPRRRTYAWPQRYPPPFREISLAGDDEIADLLPAAPEPDPENELRYDIVLELRYRGRLFAPYPPLAMYSPQLSAVRKYITDQSLRGIPQARFRRGPLRYSVWIPASVGQEHARPLAAEREDLGSPSAPPPEFIPVGEAVRNFAVGLWREAGEPDIHEPAERSRLLDYIAAHLRSNRYTYTLNVPERPDESEPVEYFLFTSRRGHCEIYATTMAVICHILDIPARYVSGFVATDYNQVADCFIVRQKDAHAWVEAYVPGRDWARYDPTPMLVEEMQTGSWWETLADYVDYWRLQWISLVVSYNAVQRNDAFGRLREWFADMTRGAQEAPERPARSWLRELLFGSAELDWGRRAVYWLAVALTLSVLVAIVRAGYLLAARGARTIRGRRRPAPGAEYYQRLLAVLAAAGFRPTDAQTPREFVAHVIHERPFLATAGEVVERYYAIRYGRRRAEPSEAMALGRLLAQLKAAVRGG
ncbi:MAG: transglutaminase domain-containing protein [Phycisphaerales bacterium]|nr:MAG: transglutaminase domain-containing protein [Phycisphaerales bacterium]